MDTDFSTAMFEEGHCILMELIEELHPEGGELHTAIWLYLWRQRTLLTMAKQFHREEVQMIQIGVPASVYQAHAGEHKRLLSYIEYGTSMQDPKRGVTAGDLYQPLKSEFLKHFLMFDSVAKQCVRLNGKLVDATVGDA
ncbi:MAG TPA: hypothetical protein VFW68_06075 [Rhodocyclaceae bacterium]|nr:hypothetical protein [Rhodocyclaceae bacterium]